MIDRVELSVIIPSFNTGNYIAEAVLSVAQDVPDAEIIVVDDASTDNTIEKLQQLKLDNLVIIPLEHNSPGGAGFPSNVGLQHARGEYIGFVDSDDFFYTGYLSALLMQIKSTRTDICVGSYTLVDTVTHAEKPAHDNDTWQALLGETTEGIMPKENYFRLSPEPWRKVYHSRLFVNPGVRFPVNGWFNEDFPFHWFAGLEETNGISYVNNADYYHRVSRVGQTTAALDERIFFVFDHADEIIKFMKSDKKYQGYEGYLLNWLLIGVWKLRLLKVKLDEYFLKYRALILSFDESAVTQLYAFALPQQRRAYEIIKSSESVPELYRQFSWKSKA